MTNAEIYWGVWCAGGERGYWVTDPLAPDVTLIANRNTANEYARILNTRGDHPLSYQACVIAESDLDIPTRRLSYRLHLKGVRPC